MILSTKEKKRVLEYLEQNKSYQEIQDQIHISSRDISFIVKKAKEKQRRRKEKISEIRETIIIHTIIF
jgi:DNA-binding CsgD family transcriptional regulator